MSKLKSSSILGFNLFTLATSTAGFVSHERYDFPRLLGLWRTNHFRARRRVSTFEYHFCLNYV